MNNVQCRGAGALSRRVLPVRVPSPVRLIRFLGNLGGGVSRPAAGRAVLLVVALLAAGRTQAADPYRASSSRASRKDAIQAIPIEKLTDSQRARVADVLRHATLFRRLPTQVIACDPDMYMFMANHPEILASIWQLLEIEDVVLKPTGSGIYEASDGAGTKGTLEFLYRSHNTHLMIAEGSYDGPLFANAVRGRAVMLLKTGYSKEPDGRYYITSRLDVFLDLDHVGLSFLAKAFQPLVGRVADYNFTATAHFIEDLSRVAEDRPRRVEDLAAQLESIDESVRRRFVEVSYDVADKATMRRAKYGDQPPFTRGVPRTARAQNR